MSPTIISIVIALLTALPPTIVALAALIASIKNSGKIHEVHLSLNSRLSELIIASKSQGRQEERDNQSADAAKVIELARVIDKISKK